MLLEQKVADLLQENQVSIVIVNKNYGNYLYTCINSVLEQEYEFMEIIVVDDCSSDNSWDVIQRFGEKIVSVQTPGVGVAAARNIGISKASGQYLAFLDSDDFWRPRKITKQIQALKKSQASAVYCGLVIYQEHLNRIERELTPKYRGDCSFWFRRFPTQAILLLASSSLLVDRFRIKNELLFCECLSVSADWDFTRRLCDENLIEYVEEPLVTYRIHRLNMSHSILKTYRDWIVSCFLMIIYDLRRGNIFRVFLGFKGIILILAKDIVKQIKIHLN